MAMLEKHYSVQELAKMWRCSEETIRRLFRDESGVLKIGSAEPRFKRKRLVLKIPESAVQRVHQRLAK
jgi:transcriptional regulator GlxA family with amidase domain